MAQALLCPAEPFAESTWAATDKEVQKVLRNAENQAASVLEEHRDVFDRLVELLMKKETVEGSEVYALVGRTEPSAGQGRTIVPDRAVSAWAPGPIEHRVTVTRPGEDDSIR